ncbi:MAG: histidinol dehydrogenase [Kiritimatiellia bacterium]|jgi:histidinol dehydrogenase|nr:histidinol dehydrogenase [Kiritimatiellia bacterium]MDP6631109.1 histidinol dehydrogenase [Kiritimatiellia bacterium]MDP6810066.1 histidinol dehydrogenase [Kiritimatiellia bacterium]MDP7024837.1 histidinol dehydrogenase [Kiritimatiellia bacterium]
MKVRIESWTRKKGSRVVSRFLQRPAFDTAAESAARKVLKAIRSNGNAAVVAYAREFDGAELTPGTLRVKRAEIARARDRVDARIKSAIRESHKRVTAFARKGMKKDWQMPSPRGGTLGEQFKPLERVGVYVPGGAAPLASTALMTATLAKVAGVPEIVGCTPCGPGKKVDPVLLYAMETAGVTEMYKVGGIQAIGLMAYGTQSIAPVQKIVGPGGTYVTAAKRQVYGDVALDMVAGPSEIAILADETADPRYVAADLLSQAEHGTGHEKALLVTSSERLAKAVQGELEAQAALLSRQDCVRAVMKKGMLLVVAPNLDEGIELINDFAAEHLELMVREPKSWLKRVRAAGAVFVGAWSPECVGDFVAGPSHVLPTGGTAALFSGLTVDDFRRRSSFIAFTRADLLDVVPVVETFGEVEGLDGHARSARIRFE